MKLSIVVSIYNGESFVQDLVRSLGPHVGGDVELVIVNDGSTDGTGNEIEKAALKYNLTVLTNPNMGLLGAQISGAKAAKGDYLYFMDVDDSLDPSFFEDIPELLESATPDILIFNARRVFTDHRRPIALRNQIRAGLYDKEEIRKDIIPNLFCTHDLYGERNLVTNIWVKVIRRSLYLSTVSAYKDERITVAEDLLASAVLFLKAESLFVLDKAYYNYLTNPQSVMNTYKKDFFEQTALVCRNLEALCDDPVYLAGVSYERCFFAVSAYYNEFFYKSSRSREEKRRVIEKMLGFAELKAALDKINMKEVKFPNTLILRLMRKNSVNSLMRLGCFIQIMSPVLRKFILS